MDSRLFKAVEYTRKKERLKFKISTFIAITSYFSSCFLGGPEKSNKQNAISAALLFFSIIPTLLGFTHCVNSSDPYTLLLKSMNQNEKNRFLAMDKNEQRELCQEVLARLNL